MRSREVMSKHVSKRRAVKRCKSLNRRKREGLSSGQDRIDYAVERNSQAKLRRWEVTAR